MEFNLNHGLLVLLLVQFGTTAELRSPELDTETYKPQAEIVLANFGRFSEGALQNPKTVPTPIFPEDEANFSAIVDFTDSPLSNYVNGIFHICDAHASGLSSILLDYEITIPGGLALEAELTIGNISLNSINSGLISLMDFITISSYGNFEFELDNVTIDLRLGLRLPAEMTNPINITSFTLDVQVGGIKIVGEDTFLNASDNWEMVFELIATLWPVVKPILEGAVVPPLQSILDNCSTTEILEALGFGNGPGGDFSCLGLDGGLPIEFVDELTCHPRPATTTTEGPPPSSAIPSLGATPASLFAILSAVHLFLFL